jgi:hypothetical protein
MNHVRRYAQIFLFDYCTGFGPGKGSGRREFSRGGVAEHPCKSDMLQRQGAEGPLKASETSASDS